MPRPEYLICLECETEVEDFTWRDGEVRRAACEVCGNSDPDSFALPEDFDQDSEDEDDEEYEEEELIEDYDDFKEEEEEEE
jgi:hypothetical protein